MGRCAALLVFLAELIVLVTPLHAGERARSVRFEGAGACAARPLGRLVVATLDNVPIVTLQANQHPITMVLDTGAERTVLTSDAAARIKAQPPRVIFDRRMYGLARALPTREVEFDSLTADGVPVPWRRALVGAVTLAQPLGLKLDGLLGADMLSQFDNDLDLAHQQLTLYGARSCSDGPPWAGPYSALNAGLSRNEHLFFRVRLNNREMTAIFDTGAQRSTISTAAAYRAGVSEVTLEHDRPLTTRGAADERLPAHIHRFSELQIGSEAIRDPELVVTNTTFSDADIILGADFLKARRLWLSYAALKIYLSRR